MDVAALLLACSLHPDDAPLLSMAYVYAGGNPYVVLDGSFTLDGAGTLEHTAPPHSPAAARLVVDRILSVGGEPVLGLLPVRPQWADEFGKTLDDLFDPCSAIAVASAKMSEFDDACRHRGPPRHLRRRGCVLDLYARGVGLVALGRAVLADMTLPAPFSSEAELGEGLPASAMPSLNSGLFFPTAPPQPAPVWTSPAEPLQ